MGLTIQKITEDDTLDYYIVETDDKNYPDRWFLTHPRDATGLVLDAREFTYANRYNGPVPASIPIGQYGRSVQFHLASFDMPVVSACIGKILSQISPDTIQRFPVVVGDGIHGFEIVNVVQSIACVDETQARVMKWTPSDGRSEKAGKYRQIIDLKIDPSHVGSVDIFRIKDWEIALIISSRLADLLSKIPDTGVVFVKVT